MPSHLSFASIIKVKMNGCFVLVFMLCGFARRISLNMMMYSLTDSTAPELVAAVNHNFCH